MSAEEKKQDLIQKFLPLTESQDYCNDIAIPHSEQVREASRMELICVEEILNAYEFGGTSSTRDINFWREVKTILNK